MPFFSGIYKEASVSLEVEETEPELSVMRESIDVLRKSDVKVGGREGGREGRGGEREGRGGGREGGRKGGGREGGREGDTCPSKHGGHSVILWPTVYLSAQFFKGICTIQWPRGSNFSLPVKYHVHVHVCLSAQRSPCVNFLALLDDTQK